MLALLHESGSVLQVNSVFFLSSVDGQVEGEDTVDLLDERGVGGNTFLDFLLRLEGGGKEREREEKGEERGEEKMKIINNVINQPRFSTFPNNKVSNDK